MKVTKYVLNVNFFSKVFQILGFSYNSNNNNDNHNNNNNNNTAEPPLSSNLLNGHPLLRGRLPKSGNNFDVILAFSTRVFPLLSPLSSAIKRFIHLVWLYFKNMMKEK